MDAASTVETTIHEHREYSENCHPYMFVLEGRVTAASTRYTLRFYVWDGVKYQVSHPGAKYGYKTLAMARRYFEKHAAYYAKHYGPRIGIAPYIAPFDVPFD